MQVDYLVVADAAAAVEGKHYIHGAGWDRLLAASFPVTHPLMSVAIRFRIGWTETNQPHEMELDVVDEDGRSILSSPPGPPRGVINVGRPHHLTPGEDQVLPLALSLHNLTFDRPGLYAVVLRLDGQDVGRSTFRVAALQPGTARPSA